MHNFRPLAYFCALLALTVSLSACQREAAQAGESAAEAKAEARAEATAARKAEFRARTYQVQTQQFTPMADPLLATSQQAQAISLNLYEPLLAYPTDSRRTADLQPLLATEWEGSQDGLEYRLTLRGDVLFHSGRTLECADAEYSLRRVLVAQPPRSLAYLLAGALLGGEEATWAGIAGAVSCEGETLVLRLERPDPDFLTYLTLAPFGIVDREAAAAAGQWNGEEATWQQFRGNDLESSPLALTTLGTGAYQLLSVDNDTLIFGRHEHYWGGEPYFERVALSAVPLLASRVMAFVRGDADQIELDSSFTDINHTLDGVEGYQAVLGGPREYASVIGFNPSVTNANWRGKGDWNGEGIPADLMADKDMRLCIRYAFDYALLDTAVLMGSGVQRGAPVPETYQAAPKLPAPTQDLSKAEEYCRAARGGEVWDKGFRLKAVYTGAHNRLPLEILGEELSRLNPLFRLEPTPTSYVEEAALGVYGWYADFPTTPNFADAFYRSSGTFAGYTGLNNSQVDAWLDRAAGEPDPQRRAELYQRAAQMVDEEARYIVLPVPTAAVVARDSVTGISPQTLQPETGVLWKELGRK